MALTDAPANRSDRVAGVGLWVLLGVPLGLTWLLGAVFLVPTLIDAWSELEPGARVAALAVIAAPLVAWELGGRGWRRSPATGISAILALVALATIVGPTIAANGTGLVGARATATTGDTRRWVTVPLTASDIVVPVVVGLILVALVILAGALARRRRDTLVTPVLWGVAAIMCLVWVPFTLLRSLGEGLASHSRFTPVVDVLWGLKLLGQVTGPVIAVVAGLVLVQPRRRPDPTGD